MRDSKVFYEIEPDVNDVKTKDAFRDVVSQQVPYICRLTTSFSVAKKVLVELFQE